MNIARFVFNPIAENTYVVWKGEKGAGGAVDGAVGAGVAEGAGMGADGLIEAAVIDAGNSTPAEDAVLEAFFAEKGLRPVLAINTHGHFDHALGVPFLKRVYDVPFAAHGGDGFLLENAATSGQIFGVKASPLPAVDIDLATRETILFGGVTLEIIPTPGHTPGHVCLFDPVSRVVFTGDTLFADSIGRTDLPGGDYSWIMRSIIEKLLPLGGDVRVYPGHGSDTTIGHEANNNPFITEVLDGLS
jgi:glyoxylase-like metal-dependent hydrolase (beta-lactamase superfamily II)